MRHGWVITIMFGDSRVKRHQSFLSHKIILSFYRCSWLYEWPHSHSYSAGCNQPSQVDHTLRHQLEKCIYIPPITFTCEYIEYYNDIRNRNAREPKPAPPLVRGAWNSLTKRNSLFTICAPPPPPPPSLFTICAPPPPPTPTPHPMVINYTASYLTDTNSYIVAFHHTNLYIR